MPSFSSTRSFIRDTCGVSVTSIRCTARRGVGRDRGRVPGPREKRNPPCSPARCRVQSPCPSGCALCFARVSRVSYRPTPTSLGQRTHLICMVGGACVGCVVRLLAWEPLWLVCRCRCRGLFAQAAGGDCEGRQGGGGGQGEEGAQPHLPRRCLSCGAPVAQAGPQGQRQGERERKHITYSKPSSSVYLPSETFVVHPEPRCSRPSASSSSRASPRSLARTPLHRRRRLRYHYAPAPAAAARRLCRTTIPSLV
jgi:hypothetical protein